MPWCDDCDRFLNPNSVSADGTCPSCGSPIIKPRALERARKGRGSSADAEAARAQGTDGSSTAQPDRRRSADVENQTTPWHFKVLLVALVLYLGWRLVQGVLWVTHQL